MNKAWEKGNFADIPFARLLFLIWQDQKSGSLKILKKTDESIFHFKKGSIAVTKESFDRKRLCEYLTRKEALLPSGLKKLDSLAAPSKDSLIKSLLELQILTPSQLWMHLKDLFKADAFSLFDLSRADYLFEEKEARPPHEILFSLPAPAFIIEGIHQMQNFDLIRAHLPLENENVQIFSSEYPGKIELTQSERYLLQLIESQECLRKAYEKSELGKKESQRIVFGFSILSVLSFPRIEARHQTSPELTKADFHKILEAFNKKCSYIFRYISKETGPVALSVLEKCLEDAKLHLSPLFQDITLGKNGVIETTPDLRYNFKSSDEDSKEELLRALNEILAAEVLAAKKTLGPWHESALVQNLERIGEWR